MKLSELRVLPCHQGGKITHFAEDEHGRILVIDEGDLRVLSFDSLFEQSSMHLSYPNQLVHTYTQIMLLVLAFVEPRQVTLLGLGGASLLRTLHHLLCNCQFHIVELRQAVVDIAQEYFSQPNDHRVVISINDALEEITQLEDASCDIIFSDLYDAYKMVPGQLHRAFLTQCSRVLSAGGWLVANLHNLPADQVALFAELRSLFPTVILSTIADNTILMASKIQPQQARPNLVRLASIEKSLQQPLIQLLPRLRPLDFQLER